MKILIKRYLIYFSIIGFLFAILLGYASENLCVSYVCEDAVDAVAVPLGFFTLSLIPISLFLFFLREEVFHLWWKFSRWYLSIAFILIIVSSGGGVASGLGSLWDQEIAVWWTAGLFFIISLIIIIYKTISIRRKEKSSSQ